MRRCRGDDTVRHSEPRRRRGIWVGERAPAQIPRSTLGMTTCELHGVIRSGWWVGARGIPHEGSLVELEGIPRAHPPPARDDTVVAGGGAALSPTAPAIVGAR